MNSRRASRAGVLLVVAAAGLAAPSAAAAGTVTPAGFSDPGGAADDLVVDLQFEAETPSVDPPGWSVSYLGSVTPGPGCGAGFVGAICAFGAAPPGALAVDLGAGDDQLQLGLEADAAAATTRITVAGGPGADRILTVRARAELDGGAGDDVLAPDERYANDDLPGPTPGGVIRGGPGIDVVGYENALDPVLVSLDGRANDGRAGEGDDVRADVENIAGGPLGDTLRGSARPNRIEANDGDDVVDVLDGRGADAVDCGAGADVVLADAGDAVAPQDCERTTWAPGLSGASLRVRDGRIPVRLACPGASAAGCRGTVRIATAITVAAGAYRVPAGRRATLRLAPTRRGRAALDRKGALRARITVQPAGTRGAAGRGVAIR